MMERLPGRLALHLTPLPALAATAMTGRSFDRQNLHLAILFVVIPAPTEGEAP